VCCKACPAVTSRKRAFLRTPCKGAPPDPETTTPTTTQTAVAVDASPPEPATCEDEADPFGHACGLDGDGDEEDDDPPGDHSAQYVAVPAHDPDAVARAGAPRSPEAGAGAARVADDRVNDEPEAKVRRTGEIETAEAVAAEQGQGPELPERGPRATDALDGKECAEPQGKPSSFATGRAEGDDGEATLTAVQAKRMAENREAALEIKRQKFRHQWAEDWSAFDDEKVEVPVAAICDRREMLLDQCLRIQLDQDGEFDERRKDMAEEILRQLEVEPNADDAELDAKRRRLEPPEPASDAQHASVDEAPGFPLTQELAAVMDDDSSGGEDAPPEKPIEVIPKRRVSTVALDPLASDLLKLIHHSHRMRTFRGLAWCVCCGCYAAYVGASKPHIRDLGADCRPPRPKGVDNLRRLNLYPRRWPHPLKAWPDAALAARQQELRRGVAIM